MAAIQPTSVNPDSAYGQNVRQGCEILALPFSASDADTFTVPAGLNVLGVAWHPSAANQFCAPSITRLSTTTRVTFTTDAGTVVADPKVGTLIIFHGGAS